MSDDSIDVEGVLAKVDDEVIGMVNQNCFGNNDPSFGFISDGVTKCQDCGHPSYITAPDGCNSPGNHYAPQPLIPNVQIPIVSTGLPSSSTNPFTIHVGPTVLDLAKALRECFEKSGGDVPTEPLDDLIAQHEPPLGVATPDQATVERRLKKALELLKKVKDAEQVEVEWDRETAEFLKENGVKDE